MLDDFFECGMVSAMHDEYLRGYAKGFEACMQILTGVMKASLESGDLVNNEHLARLSQLPEIPEGSKALAAAIHIASDKKVYDRILKEKADPMTDNAIKLLMHELAETVEVPTPLAALGGQRNKPPRWH